MTATERNLRECDATVGTLSVAEVVVRHIERTCRTAIDGRRAGRALAEWAQRFELGEAEFQLLWCLRSAAGDGVDQKSLAKELAFSAAQVSATVERVRKRCWVRQGMAAGDRRRHLWQLSAAGHDLLNQMLSTAALLRYEPVAAGERMPTDRSPREAAA